MAKSQPAVPAKLPANGRDVYTARLAAREKHKYLSTALFAMVAVITDQVPTTAVDRYWRLYINPTFFADCDLEAGAGCMIHEVWHLLSRHALRSDAMQILPEERDIANIAADLEINQKDDLHVALAKALAPSGGKLCMPDLYNLPPDLIYEEYWELIRKNIKHVTVGIPNPCGESSPMPGSGKCGSAASGQHGTQPWELPAPDGSKTGAPGVTATRANILIDETARNIIEAAKTPGSVPAGWLRWAEKIVDPKVDWRSELPVAIQGAIAPATGNASPTYRRMSRRQNPDIVKPGHLAAVPVVAVIVDTSGSMSDDMLAQGLGEVDGVLMALGSQTEVAVYFTDCATAPVQKVQSARSLRPIGGGGTDMGRGWEAIVQDMSEGVLTEPDLIICVTDGYTPWPAEPPVECRHVILVLTEDGTAPGWATEGDSQYKLVRCDITVKQEAAALQSAGVYEFLADLATSRKGPDGEYPCMG